jgi:hypothetical protein
VTINEHPSFSNLANSRQQTADSKQQTADPELKHRTIIVAFISLG